MRRAFAALVLLLIPVLAAWLKGAPIAGEMLLTLGFPSAAARILEDPAWRGVALYRAGRWQEAVLAFGEAPQNAYNKANALLRDGRYDEALSAYNAAIAFDPSDEDAVFNRSLLSAFLHKATPNGGEVGQTGAGSAATKELDSGHDLGTEEQRGGGGGLFAGNKEGSSTREANSGSKVGKTGNAPGKTSQTGVATGSAANSDGIGRSGGLATDYAQIFAERRSRIERHVEIHSILPTREWLASLPDDPGLYLKLRLLAEQQRRKKSLLVAR